MTTQCTIRDELPSDPSIIESVTAAAFQNALHTSRTEQYIISALRKASALTVSQVAEVEGRVVGHVAISPVTIADGTAGWYGLGPISVLPDRQGQGIGSRLMRSALGRLQDCNAGGCVVLGDPGFYGRFGFQTVSGLSLPGVPPEYFQAVLLKGDWPQGIVTYHAAFCAQV